LVGSGWRKATECSQYSVKHCSKPFKACAAGVTWRNAPEQAHCPMQRLRSRGFRRGCAEGLMLRRQSTTRSTCHTADAECEVHQRARCRKHFLFLPPSSLSVTNLRLAAHAIHRTRLRRKGAGVAMVSAGVIFRMQEGPSQTQRPRRCRLQGEAEASVALEVGRGTRADEEACSGAGGVLSDCLGRRATVVPIWRVETGGAQCRRNTCEQAWGRYFFLSLRNTCVHMYVKKPCVLLRRRTHQAQGLQWGSGTAKGRWWP
jgi:hypothetical protein